MFGWKRKPLSPREEVTLSRFLSMVVQIDPDSISYTTYRGYNGSRPDACLVVGFGLDMLDRSDKGFLIEMCDATFARGQEIASAVSTYHKEASNMSKLSGQPLFDEIVKLQVRHDMLTDRVEKKESGKVLIISNISEILDRFDDGEMTWSEMREAIISIVMPELDASLDRFASGEISQSELMQSLEQLTTQQS